MHCKRVYEAYVAKVPLMKEKMCCQSTAWRKDIRQRKNTVDIILLTLKRLKALESVRKSQELFPLLQCSDLRESGSWLESVYPALNISHSLNCQRKIGKTLLYAYFRSNGKEREQGYHDGIGVPRSVIRKWSWHLKYRTCHWHVVTNEISFPMVMVTMKAIWQSTTF